MYKTPLAAAIQPMRDLGACGDEITGHNTGISLLLSTSVWVSLSPPIELPETTHNGLTSLSTDGVAKEGRPKFNPRTKRGRGLNPRPHGWQSEILPTALTSHNSILPTVLTSKNYTKLHYDIVRQER